MTEAEIIALLVVGAKLKMAEPGTNISDIQREMARLMPEGVDWLEVYCKSVHLIQAA